MMIYVCSPYRAKDKTQFERQKDYTKLVSREVVLAGHEAITPHMYYPDFLNDNDPRERKIGMKSALRLLDVCDAILVNTQLNISDGMKKEIEYAKQKDMKILTADSISSARGLLKYQS